jgi:hypothetical protein
MSKTRLNISLDNDLADYVRMFAQENRTTASELITQFILGLKRRTQGDSMDIIFSNPEFYHALTDVQAKLKDGSAQWFDFKDVFGE